MEIKTPKTLKIQPGQMKGLMQGVDENLLKPSYSPDCQNIDVSEGIISTRKGGTKSNTSSVPPSIKKIMRFYNSDPFCSISILGTTDSENNHRWYAYYDKLGAGNDWYELTYSGGVEALRNVDPTYANYIMYEMSGTPYLILTSYRIDVYKISLTGTTGSLLFVVDYLGGSPQDCNFITLHKDRTWLAGDYDNKNTVYYSNQYDPEDWSTAGEAGEISIYTANNDYIIGIVNWLDDVLIFKKNTIWRVEGDTPGEYVVKQVYSVQGTIWKDSLCSDGNYCFFAGSDGIYQYNGIEAVPILTSEIKDVYENMNNISCMLLNNKLYIMDKGTPSYASVPSVVYDIRTKTIEVLYITGGITAVGAFTGPYDNSLYYGTGEENAFICYLKDNKIVFNGESQENIDAYWYFPESDCGYPNAEKTLTGVYFTGWGTTSAGAAGGQVKITVYYTKKNGTQATKEKTVTLQTTRKLHYLRFYARGRLFKFKIENVDGSAMNISNPEFVFELAED